MADIILTKANPGFYYCQQGSGASKCSEYQVCMMRWNSATTSSWVRSEGFTTGDYDVTNITITINDMKARENKQGTPTVGIGTVIDDYPGKTDTPEVLWSASDTTVSLPDGVHNQYSMTFNVDMKARTTYYLYLYTQGTNTSSELAWQVLDHPNKSSDTRVSTVEITFNSYSLATPKYTLTLNKDAGISRVSGAGSYEAGTYITATATPASGYTFKNWTNSSGTAMSTNASYSFYMPAGNTTYTANSNLTSYIVNYNAGNYSTGGTNTSANKTHGVALTLPGAIFTRTGYTQIGWSKNADGSTQDYTTSYTDDRSITLYPYWQRNIYTLTINPNGGSMYNGANKTTSTFTTTFAYGVKTYLGNLYDNGGVLVAHNDNTPTRVGYTFTGFTFSNGSGQKNSAGAIYYFNGQSPEDNSSKSGASTSAYIFNGNYAGNVTVTANWTGNTYTVKYNANGGIGTTASSTHTYGTAKALTANGFSKTGYSFTGWNTAANGSGESYSDKQSVSTLTTGSEIELFAQWGQASYQVIFDPQGGTITSGNFDPKTYIVGSSYTLPTGTITKPGYVFLGWAKTSTATTASYSNGGTISNLGTSGATVILYAVWRPKKFTIKYNANNGATTSSSTQYTATSSNSLLTLPSSWTKSGYSASGWSTSNTATSASYAFGQAFNDFEEVADGGTLNLYVVWTKNIPWKLTLIKAKFGGVEYTL